MVPQNQTVLLPNMTAILGEANHFISSAIIRNPAKHSNYLACGTIIA
jgi:hypothetical protein